MDALHFAYWLRGYTEITNGAYPNATQWQVIQDHLNEVFVKVTPDRVSPSFTTGYHNLTFSNAGQPVSGGNAYFSPINCSLVCC